MKSEPPTDLTPPDLYRAAIHGLLTKLSTETLLDYVVAEGKAGISLLCDCPRVSTSPSYAHNYLHVLNYEPINLDASLLKQITLYPGNLTGSLARWLEGYNRKSRVGKLCILGANADNAENVAAVLKVFSTVRVLELVMNTEATLGTPQNWPSSLQDAIKAFDPAAIVDNAVTGHGQFKDKIGTFTFEWKTENGTIRRDLPRDKAASIFSAEADASPA